MAELLHRRIGSSVVENGVDLLFTFGENAAFVADEAIKLGFDESKVFVFTDITDEKPISASIKEHIKETDCVLIKASNGVNMGRIAKILQEN